MSRKIHQHQITEPEPEFKILDAETVWNMSNKHRKFYKSLCYKKGIEPPKKQISEMGREA